MTCPDLATDEIERLKFHEKKTNVLKSLEQKCVGVAKVFVCRNTWHYAVLVFQECLLQSARKKKRNQVRM